MRRRGSDDGGGVTRAGVNDDYNLRTVWFVTLSTSDGSDAVRAGKGRDIRRVRRSWTDCADVTSYTTMTAGWGRVGSGESKSGSSRHDE